MALVINDRVKETSTTTGTGTFDLAGAATGFQTFVAGIATGNTTYYAIFNQGTTEWEVGTGTVTDATPDTLSRTTIYSSSNSDSAVDFAAGTKDVFCTLPASKAVFGKQEGTDFTDSLLVGHSTTGTLDAATKNTIVGIDAGNAVTTGDSNTLVGFDAGGAIGGGGNNTLIGANAGALVGSNSNITAVGANALKICIVHSNTALGADAGDSIYNGQRNIVIGYDAGQNISSGSGNIIIGSVDADSATGDRQLKITGYDGSTTTTWIQGDGNDHVEVAVAWNPSLSTTGKAFVMGF
jgi:hypothetical protein